MGVLAAEEKPLKERIEERIKAVVAYYKLDERRFRATLHGESGTNHYRKDGKVKINNVGATGIAQFIPVTFNSSKVKMGYPEYDINNWEHQLNLMGWMWSKGRECEWEVYQRLFGCE